LFILENKKTRIFPQNFIKPQKAWVELPDNIKCPMTENFSTRRTGILACFLKSELCSNMKNVEFQK